MEKTRVKLRICDIDCTITSDDNEEYVRTIGNEIDRAISAVLKKNDRISLSMAAIITAMTYCDESAKAKAELAELRALDKRRASEYDQLKQAAETAKAEAEQLRSELQILHTFLTQDKDMKKMPVSPGTAPTESNASTPVQNGSAAATDTAAPAGVQEAHTLEELRNSIDADALPPISNSLTANAPAKHGKQNRHQKKQQKMAQKAAEKAGLITGSYTRPKSPVEPELPSDRTFLGYFEQK